MRTLIFCFVIILSPFFALSQTVLSNKSKPFNVNMEPVFERGLAPSLFVELEFIDENKNGIIEAEESALFNLSITNKGKGSAQGLKLNITDNIIDSSFSIDYKKELYFVHPGETKNIKVKLYAGFDIRTAKHELEINIKEHFGYDIDPAKLILNTLEFQKPRIVFSGIEIIDYGAGTVPLIEDGLLQAGEMVKARLVVQNAGLNVAKDVRYSIECSDSNIFVRNITGEIGDLDIGEVKDIFITLSPNKRVVTESKLPLFLSVTESKGVGDLINYNLPLVLNQKPMLTNTLAVKADFEEFKKQVARFEYSSNRFNVNLGHIYDINDISPSKTIRENSVAVILGIENYKNLPSAPYAQNDAAFIKKYFENRLGIKQVVILTNEEVSGFAFDDIFNPEYGELQRSILKGQTDVFVFYSGHGLPNKKGDEIYLFPSDGKVERIEAQGYNLNRLYESLDKLEAKSVTVFLDACFSGASKASQTLETNNLISNKGVRITPKIVHPWVKNKNFTVFASSGFNETSLGFDVAQTGLFTYYLCIGMQGMADADGDRKITLGEMKEYVIRNVIDTSKKIRGVQTPEFHGDMNLILLEY